MHALLSWHSMSARQPEMHINPSQISPLLQSSSRLQSDLQIPELSHLSLLKQFALVEQTAVQMPLMQAMSTAQSRLAWQIGPGDLRHAIFAVGFGIKPDGQEQVARWLKTVHLAFGPHDVASHGFTHLFAKHASFALQSSSARQPNEHILFRQMWPRKQSLSNRQVSKQLPLMHFSFNAHSSSAIQIGKQTFSRQVLPSLQSLLPRQDTGTASNRDFIIMCKENY